PAALSALAGISRATTATTRIASTNAAKTKAATLLARAWLTGSRLAILFGTATFDGFFALARAAPPRRTWAAVTEAPPRSGARPARRRRCPYAWPARAPGLAGSFLVGC